MQLREGNRESNSENRGEMEAFCKGLLLSAQMQLLFPNAHTRSKSFLCAS